MPTKFWTAQSILMQSAIGAAQTITGITKASPGVITKDAGANLPATGDYVLLEVAGMTQLNYRLCKVSGASGSTFNVGIDTSAFGTFTTGTYRVVSMALAFTGVRDPQSGGGDPIYEDTTTIQDVSDTQAIVSSSPETFSFTCDWTPADTALKAANTAFVTRTPRGFSIADPDGSAYLFYGTVAAPLNPTVSGRKKVTPVAIALLGTGTAI